MNTSETDSLDNYQEWIKLLQKTEQEFVKTGKSPASIVQFLQQLEEEYSPIVPEQATELDLKSFSFIFQECII